MLDPSSGINETELVQWIENSLATQTNNLAAGYQGQALKYVDERHQLAIKVPHGRGPLKYFHIRLLRHEYDVYRRLKGFEGVPACYGMAGGRYLVLQLIDGTTIGEERPSDESAYFSRMLEYIKQMHAMGVAHFDLKKKTNLLVTGDGRPCLIDLGVAVIFKTGFHPLNKFLFNMARQFDFNAWIRHKYNKNIALISDEDRHYYKKTRVEKYTWKIKRFYKDSVKPKFRRNTG